MTWPQYAAAIHLGLFTLIATTKYILQWGTTRHNPIVLGRGKTGFALFVERVSPLFFIVWLFELTNFSFNLGWRVLPELFYEVLITGEIFKLAGATLLVFSIVIFAASLIAFGPSWRIGVDTERPGPLVTTGIFAYSRNPIYVAVDLWFLAICLLGGTVFFLIAALLALLTFHIQIRLEEKFLSAFYGAEYQNYRSKVRRYL